MIDVCQSHVKGVGVNKPFFEISNIQDDLEAARTKTIP